MNIATTKYITLIQKQLTYPLKTPRMSDSDSSYNDELYDSFSIVTPSPDPLAGDDMTDVDMVELERDSPLLFTPRPQQQQEQPQQQYEQPQQQQPQYEQRQQDRPNSPTGDIHHTTGQSGRSIKDRLKALLILRTPRLVEAVSSNHNNCIT